MPKDPRQRTVEDSKYTFTTYSKARSYQNSPSNLKLRQLQNIRQSVLVSSAKKAKSRIKRVLNNSRNGSTVKETKINLVDSRTESNSNLPSETPLETPLVPDKAFDSSVCMLTYKRDIYQKFN